MYNTFFYKRMVFGQQRELAQHPGGLPHDQPDKAQCDTKIKEVHRYMVRGDMLAGEYHLEKVQPVTEDQKYGHKSYRAPIAFRASFHQDQQWA